MTYQPDSQVRWIVQHYSATPTESVYTYAQLERDHIARGFRKGGYHFYLPLKGGRITGRDLSKPGKFEVGAHCKGSNSNSIGICLEGGVTKAAINVGFDTRTPAQIKEQIALIRELLVRFPNAKVEGHRDMPGAATQCPGYDAAAWWYGVINAKPAKASPGPWPALWAAIAAIFGARK